MYNMQLWTSYVIDVIICRLYIHDLTISYIGGSWPKGKSSEILPGVELGEIKNKNVAFNTLWLKC